MLRPHPTRCSHSHHSHQFLIPQTVIHLIPHSPLYFLTLLTWRRGDGEEEGRKCLKPGAVLTAYSLCLNNSLYLQQIGRYRWGWDRWGPVEGEVEELFSLFNGNYGKQWNLSNFSMIDLGALLGVIAWIGIVLDCIICAFITICKSTFHCNFSNNFLLCRMHIQLHTKVEHMYT